MFFSGLLLLFLILGQRSSEFLTRNSQEVTTELKEKEMDTIIAEHKLRSTHSQHEIRQKLQNMSQKSGQNQTKV